jgi:hypothetical protein
MQIRRGWLFGLLPVCLAAQQMPPTRPDIEGISPHGAQRGTLVDVTIRGSNLENASRIEFATPKIQAEIRKVQHNQIEARIHLDAAVEPGRHDLRLIAPHGSTVAWFEVGDRSETKEQEPNNDIQHAQSITLPTLINGKITQGDYDFYKFEARAGETLTFDVSARRYGSAVDSVLSLFDQNGTQLAYIDDYYWFKDPHLVYTFKKAGTYIVRVNGTSESGSPSGDYRLTAGAMPQVDYVMPVGTERGKTAEIRLSGVNLESVESAVLGEGIATAQLVSHSNRSAVLRISVPKDAPLGLQELHVNGATLPVPFVISDLPQVVVTTASAGREDDPVPLTLPVVANGVIDGPHVGHYFSFRIDQPQNVLLAVESMRLNYDMDPMIVLYDESGNRVAYQDDTTPTNSGKRPANVDPHLVLNLKPGRYTALVRDNSYRGDPAFAYRFVLKKAEPDYTAGIIGSDETLFRGKETILTVRVRRLEGWNTPIEVWADNLPKGVTGPGKVIVPVEPTHFRGTCAEDNILDGTEVEYRLDVAADAPISLNQIQFHARGVIEGKTVEHPVIANYWWQGRQAIWGPTQTPPLYATIADAPQLILEVPDRISAAGGKGTIKVVITRLDSGKDPLELQTVGSPAGVVVEPAVVAAGGTLAEIHVTAPSPGPVSIVLQGKTNGQVLGRSHPIVIDPKAGADATGEDP